MSNDGGDQFKLMQEWLVWAQQHVPSVRAINVESGTMEIQQGDRDSTSVSVHVEPLVLAEALPALAAHGRALGAIQDPAWRGLADYLDSALSSLNSGERDLCLNASVWVGFYPQDVDAKNLDDELEHGESFGWQ